MASEVLLKVPNVECYKLVQGGGQTLLTRDVLSIELVEDGEGGDAGVARVRPRQGCPLCLENALRTWLGLPCFLRNCSMGGRKIRAWWCTNIACAVCMTLHVRHSFLPALRPCIATLRRA